MGRLLLKSLRFGSGGGRPVANFDQQWAHQHSSLSQGPRSPDGSAPQPKAAALQALQGQIDLLQLREEKLRQQILYYELEIEQLLHQNQILEYTIQELPEVYRRKFQARVQPIREKIHTIQQENQQLRSDLQDLSLQLQHNYFEVLDQPRWFRGFPRLPWAKQRTLPALPHSGQD